MDKLEKRSKSLSRLRCVPLLSHRRSWGNSSPSESDPSRGALRVRCAGWWLMPVEPPGVCVSALFEMDISDSTKARGDEECDALRE